MAFSSHARIVGEGSMNHSPPALSLKPIAHWRRFKIRRQASTPGDSAGRATDTCYQRLRSHTSNTHSSSENRQNGSKWLHPASLSMKTIICKCFAAGIDVAMLKSEEKKVGKRRRTVWSWISFKISSLLRSVIFDGSIQGRSSSPLLLL